MEMIFEKATLEDIDELVAMRIAYLVEDYNGLQDSEKEKIEKSLPDYYKKHLNQDLIICVARENKIASCVFLLITEKPANPSFISGKTGTVLNVYTKPEYRKRGLASKLMNMLLEEAKERKLDFVELKATEDGYPLYKAIGFEESVSKYKQMKYVL